MDSAPVFVDLATLDRERPLRNMALADIQAEYRHRAGKEWKRILPKYKIARCTYNQLGAAWTDFDLWRVPYRSPAAP